MTTSVRKLRYEDDDRAIRALVRAFAGDPFVEWMVRQDGRSYEGRRTFFETALLQITKPFGECWVTDDVEGAALWNPPGTWQMGLLDKLGLLPEFFRTSGLSRILDVFLGTNKVTAAHPHTPHYYLFILGVDPAAQGRGLGRALVAPVLARCDRERLPAYLETSKDTNLPFYQSLGFRVVRELDLTRGPHVWCMERAPK